MESRKMVLMNRVKSRLVDTAGEGKGGGQSEKVALTSIHYHV